MTAHGVPTTGPHGLRFRSRLEARWASLFELLGWSWSYEPGLELDGWIPDFSVLAAGPLLVEVKPELSAGALVANHKARIEASGALANYPVVLVGAALALGPGDDPVVGAVHDPAVEGWRVILWSTMAQKAGAETTPFKQAQRAWVRASNALQWKRGQ